MANLTVTIEDELLQKARERAVAERTSVNALVREYLTRYVEEQEAARRAHAKRVLAAMDDIATRLNLGGDITWTRDDLYDRHKDR
jgi:plasmid stability protein